MFQIERKKSEKSNNFKVENNKKKKSKYSFDQQLVFGNTR